MQLLSLNNISLKYGDKPLLKNISLMIFNKERICLVGRNGAGKSSLLKIIQQNIEPDSGEIVYKDNSTSEKITIENPIGHPSRREEAIPLLKDKFTRNVKSLFDTEKASEVWDKIINLEKDDDLNKFFNILNEDE